MGTLIYLTSTLLVWVLVWFSLVLEIEVYKKKLEKQYYTYKPKPPTTVGKLLLWLIVSLIPILNVLGATFLCVGMFMEYALPKIKELLQTPLFTQDKDK